MLTKRQNLLETIHGGKPDRFVNQYEFLSIIADPIDAQSPRPRPGELNAVDAWGVTHDWPLGVPGRFPVHTDDKLVVKDIAEWRDYLKKTPRTEFTDEEWAPYIEAAEKVDTTETFRTVFVAPGIFEKTHNLCEIQNTLIAFYEEPEALHELIDFLADWEVSVAKELCTHLHPEVVFHHDDWGTQLSTFMSPEMFEEFFLEPYKRVYGCYKENGVELVIHHSDCYAATLVPYMIEMGIDIWQGVMTGNDIPALIEKYGGQLSFMGGIDSAKVDFEGWTPADVTREVRVACESCGKKYFIPCTTQGLPISIYEGVYDCVTRAIDDCSKSLF